jgi:hypothetical protein
MNHPPWGFLSRRECLCAAETLAVLLSFVSAYNLPLNAADQTEYQGQRANAQTRQGPKYRPGEVIVRFRPGVPGEARSAAHAAVRGHVKKQLHIIPGLQLVEIPEGMTVEEAVAKYRKNPNVLRAYPNYFEEIQVTPDDPEFLYQ